MLSASCVIPCLSHSRSRSICDWKSIFFALEEDVVWCDDVQFSCTLYSFPFLRDFRFVSLYFACCLYFSISQEPKHVMVYWPHRYNGVWCIWSTIYLINSQCTVILHTSETKLHSARLNQVCVSVYAKVACHCFLHRLGHRINLLKSHRIDTDDFLITITSRFFAPCNICNSRWRCSLFLSADPYRHSAYILNICGFAPGIRFLFSII